MIELGFFFGRGGSQRKGQGNEFGNSSDKIKVKPRENLLEMNVALVNLWEISEPWPGGIQGGQPEGLS